MSIAPQVRTSNCQPRGAICIAIAPGAPLPLPGGQIVTDSPVSGLVYRITVKSIVKLEWERDASGAIVGIYTWVRGEKDVEASNDVIAERDVEVTQ